MAWVVRALRTTAAFIRRRQAVVGVVTTIAGALMFGVFVIGGERLNISNTGWLQGDLADFYLAWSQFSLDPHATGTLATNRLSYPLPMSVSVFDTIPLFIFIARPFAPLVPEGAQFIGLYFLTCLVLQGVFGWLATGQMLKGVYARDSLPKVFFQNAGAVFFILAPWTIVRFQGHIALSSQWMIVASIWIALWSRGISGWRWFAFNATVLIAATGISPYIALMCAMSPAILTAHDLFIRRIAVGLALARIAGLLVVAAAGLYLFGFGGAAGEVLGGYGRYSMNALGPINPGPYDTLALPQLPYAMVEQSYEGFTYIGLGLIFLLAVNLFIFRTRLPGAVNFPFVAGVAIALVAYCLALSTTVTIGEHILFKIPLPSVLEDLLARFRASGRIFWVAAFWIILLGIFGIAARLKPSHAMAAVGAALLIQASDVGAVAGTMRTVMAKFQRPILQHPIWTVSHEAAEAFIVLPAWQCDHVLTPGGTGSFQTLGFAALERRLPTNSFYAARTPSAQANFHCGRTVRDYLKEGYDYSSFVLTMASYQGSKEALSRTHTCRAVIDGAAYIVCLPHSVSVPEIAFSPNHLDFSLKGGFHALLGDGWSTPEGWGVWSIGQTSEITLPSKVDADLEVELQFFAFADGGRTQRLAVFLGEAELFSAAYHSGEQNKAAFTVPAALMKEPMMTLRIEHPDAVSPNELGAGSDPRQIAIGLVSVQLQ